MYSSGQRFTKLRTHKNFVYFVRKSWTTKSVSLTNVFFVRIFFLRKSTTGSRLSQIREFSCQGGDVQVCRFRPQNQAFLSYKASVKYESMCNSHLSALATSRVQKSRCVCRKHQSFRRDFTKKAMKNAPAKQSQLNYVC